MQVFFFLRLKWYYDGKSLLRLKENSKRITLPVLIRQEKYVFSKKIQVIYTTFRSSKFVILTSAIKITTRVSRASGFAL